MRAAIATSVLVLLVACKNEGEPGSCYREPDNACVEYGQTMGGAGKRLCSSFKWTAGEKSCPTENRLGTLPRLICSLSCPNRLSH